MVTIFRRYPGASGLVTEDGPGEAERASGPPSPALIVLAPDAASLNQRRVHSFPDADSAAAYIEFWFPREHRPTLIAFWSLDREPESAVAETVVLVRNRPDSETAYPFSFVDARSAHAFLCAEVSRGLDPSTVSVHVGVPVSVRSVADHVALSPSAPPAPVATVVAAEPVPGAESFHDTPAVTHAVSSAPPLLPDDFVDRVLRVLRIRRWQVTYAQFSGFHSPPGRF